MTELRPWLDLMAVHRFRLWVGALLMAATLLAGVGLLTLSGWFITATAVTALAWAAGLSAALEIYVPGGGIRFFALARTVARYFERLYNHDTVLRLLAELRVTLFRSLVNLHGESQYRYRAAQWLNRLTRDIDTLDNLYLRLLAPPIVALLGVILVALLVGLFLPLTGLVVLLSLLIVLAGLTLGMALWGRKQSSQIVSATDDLRVQAIEQIQGLAELSAWQVLHQHQEDLKAREHRQSADRFLLECRSAWGQALATAGVQGTVVLLLVLVLIAFQRNLISAPVMVMLPLAVMALAEGFAGLPSAFLQWGGTEAAAQRLNEQRGLESEEPQDKTHSQTAISAAINRNAPLSLQDVSLCRGAFPIFSNLCFTLAAGEKLAIVGPSGAGKSTLAALAAGLIKADFGTLCVGSTPLSHIALEVWREQMAVLTQDAHLFNDSLAANLRIANPHATDAQLWEALEQVDLKDKVREFGSGLDTHLGEFGRQLSGGEARRVALARIFLRDPAWVVLDEPLTGLDQSTAGRVKEYLNRFLSERTALLLAHEVGALPQADRVLILSENGELKGL